MQTLNLTQASELKEACLRHIGHVCLHAQLTVQVDAKIAHIMNQKSINQKIFRVA